MEGSPGASRPFHQDRRGAALQELAEAVGLAERHVSRQLCLAYLVPEVLKRLTCGREPSAVSLYDLCFLAGEAWGEQVKRAVQDARAKTR